MTEIVAKDKTDIAEFFARDPLELTDQAIEAIVDEFRSRRHQFNAGNRSAGSTKPKTAKQKTIDSIAEKIDIGSLSLDL